MKKLFLAVAFFLLSVSGFAAQPLSEDFESYKLGNTISSSVAVWRAHAGIQMSIVENPNKSDINTSNLALKIYRAPVDTFTTIKYSSAKAYRGIYTESFEIPISKANKFIELKVLHALGGKIGIRLYPDKNNTSDYKVVTVDVAPSNNWQLVKFDFSELNGEMTSSAKFQFSVELRPTIVAQKDEMTVYIDDIRMIKK